MVFAFDKTIKIFEKIIISYRKQTRQPNAWS